MIYPALGWLGPEVLISNGPRDSTINYIQRSAIRQQTGHCKKKKKKGPSLFLTFPPVLQKYLKNSTAHILVDTDKFGEMVSANGPNMGCGVGGEGRLAGVAMIGRWRGRGWKGIVIWFGQMWRKVRQELCILSALVDLICFFCVHLTATPEPLTSVTRPLEVVSV